MRNESLGISTYGCIVVLAWILLNLGSTPGRFVRVVVQRRRPIHSMTRGWLGRGVVVRPAVQIVFKHEVTVVDFELVGHVGVNVTAAGDMVWIWSFTLGIVRRAADWSRWAAETMPKIISLNVSLLAQWIHLRPPSCSPGFRHQVHHL